ncbi:MAG: hypothetical protein B6D58_01395 [candidate division Zixibacteria bacterium 4484_95]|nr:MAG: hypothetical protein B6D58_01395 [candidate division Zixibacteria bacterium 4484_95]RKX21067.1 MAG: glutamine--scyllo-inositol aminotransferase [candidate division Zixibacteria bacterium]
MGKSSEIRLTRPNISQPEIEAVTQVLLSGMLVSGPVVERFEKMLADYLGLPYAVCVSSGTAALHLSLLSADIKPGDEVLVPALSFPATANTVEIIGAVPIFIDCQPDGVNLDAEKLENKISPRSKAIMPVHAFGIPAEMDRILSVAKKYNLVVIEDAACALGSKYNNVYCGTIGELAAFSFHPRKLLTTGEGGAVISSDQSTINLVKSLRNHGYDGDDFRYPGFNYRMTDFQAGMGLMQLEKFSSMLEERKKMAADYKSMLQDIEWLKVIEAGPEAQPNIQTFIVKLDKYVDRKSLMKYLGMHGIETTIGSYCLPLMRYYRLRYGYRPEEFPHAFDNYNRLLSLPLYKGMSTQEMEKVVRALKSFTVKIEKVNG